MRPRSDIRSALAEALRAEPAICRSVAERAQVGYEATRRTLDNMRRAGEVVLLEPVRLPGVCRPVPVYALSEPAPQPQAFHLAECWAQWPDTEPLQA